MSKEIWITAIVAVLAVSAQAQVLYDGGDLTAAAGWDLRELTAPGADANNDGLIDPPANNGPIVTSDGKPAWQQIDQNTGGDFNLPFFLYLFTPDVASQLAADGFTLIVELENLGTGGAFWWGYDGDSPFGPDDARVPFVGSGDLPADGILHTVQLIWDPQTALFTRVIDDGPPVVLTMSPNTNNNYTGPDDGSAQINLTSGSSNATVSKWNMGQVYFYVAPERSLDLISIRK